MAYIYQIVNEINGKIYVGKTNFSIEKRFREHCHDAFQERNEKRPLYAAMRKYGIENFRVELLEETNEPEVREIYWIEKLASFKTGYNATLGGDGARYLDYDLIVATYQELKNEKATAEKLGIDVGSVRVALQERGEKIYTNQEVNREQYGTVVKQLNKDNGELIQVFATAKDAARYVRPNASSLGGVTSHITDVCKGKRQSAYGYKWKYAEQPE